MKITKKSVATYAERLLEVLEEQKISSLESAINAIGKEFEVREILPDRVIIHMRPSNMGTLELKISYVCPNFEGIPLELVINPSLKYRQLIVKCAESFQGYSAFAFDPYNNIVQFKINSGAEWRDAIKDIEELRG